LNALLWGSNISLSQRSKLFFEIPTILALNSTGLPFTMTNEVLSLNRNDAKRPDNYHIAAACIFIPGLRAETRHRPNPPHCAQTAAL
jgi:hypothetical protein